MTEQQKDEFEVWLEKQSDEAKTKYEAHVHGLKSALNSEREAHARFEAQVKEVSGKLEATDATRQALEKASSESGEKVGFYSKAHAAGVSDLELGYLAAKTAGLIKPEGTDFNKLKELHPGLFGSKVAIPFNAGEGNPPKGNSLAQINQVFRDAAHKN